MIIQNWAIVCHVNVLKNIDLLNYLASPLNGPINYTAPLCPKKRHQINPIKLTHPKCPKRAKEKIIQPIMVNVVSAMGRVIHVHKLAVGAPEIFN